MSGRIRLGAHFAHNLTLTLTEWGGEHRSKKRIVTRTRTIKKKPNTYLRLGGPWLHDRLPQCKADSNLVLLEQSILKKGFQVSVFETVMSKVMLKVLNKMGIVHQRPSFPARMAPSFALKLRPSSTFKSGSNSSSQSVLANIG